MTLRPLSRCGAPRYPVKVWAIVAKVRRAAAVAALAAAASLGGCSALTAQEDHAAVVVQHPDQTGEVKQNAGGRSLQWCQVEARLSGDRSPANHFTCGPVQINALPVHSAPPVVSDGRLCGNQAAWARFMVPSPMRVTLQLTTATMKLALIAPDGSPVAELGPNHQCLSLNMEAGVWTLAASPAPGAQDDHGYFEFFFERAQRTP